MIGCSGIVERQAPHPDQETPKPLRPAHALALLWCAGYRPAATGTAPAEGVRLAEVGAAYRVDPEAADRRLSTLKRVKE
jgi:hypothetical protein